MRNNFIVKIIEGNSRVLDLGCGTGELIKLLAEVHDDASFVGIDISKGDVDGLGVPVLEFYDGKIILTVRDTLSSFGLDTPSGVFYTDLAEESEIDINGDTAPDLIIYVSDLSYTDENRGVEVSVLARHGVASVGTTDVYTDDIPFASEVKSKYPQKVILEDNRAYPFTLNATFLNSCLFRDKIDSQDAVESYFTKGEVCTANPHNGIRLWISNSNAVKFTIIADTKTYNLDIGKAGHVLVEDIKWIKDNDGKYRLVVIELD